jgi:type II secretory pathway component PulL
MPSDMGITLTNIAFDAGKSELKIDLHADSLQKLNDYRDALVAAGLDVEMSSATQSGEGYNSRLTIRRLS